jgi:hypothetical protein
MLDVNGQSIGDGTLELVKFAETASAVNEITVTNSATGNAPEIAATGDDTNIDLKLTPKGTGKLNLDGIKFPNADGSAGQALTTDGSGVLSFSTISADGTADWDTTVKTTGFTATANKGYFCNTTSAGFTVTLPSTPSAGDEVIILDYAGTFDTNALVISPNGNKIEGATANLQLSGEREGVRLVYIDSTQGWLAYSGINEGTDALAPVTYQISYLVIAGGGSGGAHHGGGGGAGGYRNSFSTETSGRNSSTETPYTVSPGTVITVTVGDGGALVTSERGNTGVDSSISGSGLTTITASGGGGGGNYSNSSTGKNGGSGGGGGGGSGSGYSTAGTGTSAQGFDGGRGDAGYLQGGGGGGASAAGKDYDASGVQSNGGDGLASSISGSSVTRAGGGGGARESGDANSPATGGSGGGGTGAKRGVSLATSATINTGSGGGGGGSQGDNSGAGGKGVVILSMPLANFSGTTTGSPTESDNGTTKRLVFNGSGSYTT